MADFIADDVITKHVSYEPLKQHQEPTVETINVTVHFYTQRYTDSSKFTTQHKFFGMGTSWESSRWRVSET